MTINQRVSSVYSVHIIHNYKSGPVLLLARKLGG